MDAGKLGHKTKMNTLKEKIEENYIIFERPRCCVKNFLARDCNGLLHKLKEINPDQLLSLFSQSQTEQVKAIEELSKTWTPCNDKNCDNKEECKRANHYIRTIWNPTFTKVLSLIKTK